MAGSYKDLRVWQESFALSVAVYKLTRAFPPEELYGLTPQLRRAAVSIPSNIAEGYGRGTRRDYRSFIRLSQLYFRCSWVGAGITNPVCHRKRTWIRAGRSDGKC